MCKKFTADERNQMDHTAKNNVIFQMQDRLDKLEQNYGISWDFGANGLNLSKQTMSNWTVWTAERYLSVVYEMMKQCQLERKYIEMKYIDNNDYKFEFYDGKVLTIR